MLIMDCTLRDGANVLGSRFPDDLAVTIMEGLTGNGVDVIEYGSVKASSPSDQEEQRYLDLAKPYFDKAEVGVFLNAKNYSPEAVTLAAEKGFSFIRLGINAGEAHKTTEIIEKIRSSGMKVYFAMMKAYLLSPDDLAKEAAWLQEQGVFEATVMDSAGYMWPHEAKAYVQALKKAAPSLLVGIHSHNNLYMALANALGAVEGGAGLVDCGLLGMARSAGNIATEAAVAALNRQGTETKVDFYGLLQFLDQKLIPAMESHDYHVAVTPLELILGYSGCHSNFVPLFQKVAQETGVDLYRLIVGVSANNMRNPTEEEIRAFAADLQGCIQ